MQYASKRYLLSSDQLKNLNRAKTHDPSHKITHPHKKKALKAKSNLKATLKNPSLDELDKVIKYGQDFNKYLNNLKSALTLSKKRAILGDQSPDPVPLKTENRVANTEIQISPPPPRRSSGEQTFHTPPSSPLPSPAQPTPPIALRRPSRQHALKYSSENILKNFPSHHSDLAKDILGVLERSRRVTWNPNTGVVSTDGNVLPNSNILTYVQDRVLQKPTFSKARTFNTIFRKEEA